MALIKCPECGKEISDKASACIHCGCPASAMKQEAAAPAASQVPFNEMFQDIFGGNAGTRVATSKPVKQVPAEMPERNLLSGIVIQLLDKLCGVCSFGGMSAAAVVVAGMISDQSVDMDLLPVAVFGLVGSWLVAWVLIALDFLRARKFIRKNGYEESIRNDTPDFSNCLNAFRLSKTKMMAKYISKLNPVAGDELIEGIKQAKQRKRKERLGYLPYLAVLAVIYYLFPRYAWMFMPTYESTLITMHVCTLIVLGVYGYKKENAVGIVGIAAILFAPTIFMYYLEHMWYHVLICAAAGFVGMVIGDIISVKK